MRVLSVHKKPITCLAFSRDGTLLAEAAHGGKVRGWDVAAGKVTQTLDVSQGLFPNQVKLAFGPDGKWLAAANDCVRLFDLRTGERVKLPGKTSAFNGLHVSPDGTELVADGDQLFRWSLAARKLLPEYKFPGVEFGTWPAATFSPDGTQIAVSRRAWGISNVNTAFVLDRVTGDVVAAFETKGNDTKRLSFSPDGALLAAASGPVLRVYEVAAGAEVACLKVGKLHFLGMVFSPDGRYIATVSKDSTTRFWPVGEWGEPKTFEWKVGGLLDVAFSPDGATAAVSSDKGQIVLFDVD